MLFGLTSCFESSFLEAWLLEQLHELFSRGKRLISQGTDSSVRLVVASQYKNNTCRQKEKQNKNKTKPKNRKHMLKCGMETLNIGETVEDINSKCIEICQ